MNNDDKFMEQIGALKSERPSAELYSRIMMVVPNLPQAGTEKPARQSWLEQFFGEWRYALGVKFASLALFAVIGFCVGHLHGPPERQESFYSQILTGDIGWED
jgi:hypothetical protein